jgi:hypothetical protein
VLRPPRPPRTADMSADGVRLALVETEQNQAMVIGSAGSDTTVAAAGPPPEGGARQRRTAYVPLWRSGRVAPMPLTAVSRDRTC